MAIKIPYIAERLCLVVPKATKNKGCKILLVRCLIKVVEKFIGQGFVCYYLKQYKPFFNTVIVTK